MPETITLPNTAPAALPEALQKHKAAFYDDKGRMLQLEYNGLQQSFRIRLDAVQRLFFFEALLQKMAFRNEYGVLIGQVAAEKAGTGSVRIDGTRYRFVLSDGNTKLKLLKSNTKEAVLTCALPDEALAGNLDAAHRQHLIRCLIFSFAWALS